MLIADGRVGDIRVRLGAIAVATAGASIVSLLVAKAGEFDRLGGMELVTTILTSIKPHAPPAPPPQAPVPVESERNGVSA